MTMEMAAETSAVRSTPKPRPKRQRSRVTNGKQLFVDGNGRSPWARRWKDLCELHARDISPSGAVHLSEAQKSLIRRTATIEIELEAVEGKLSEGRPRTWPHTRRPRPIYDGCLRRCRCRAKARDHQRDHRRHGAAVEWSPLKSRWAAADAAERTKADAPADAEAVP